MHLRSLTLLAIAAWGWSADPVLEWEVDSDRVIYAPGATAQFDVRVISREADHPAGQLVVLYGEGLAAPKEIARQALPLKKHDWSAAAIPVPLGTVIGGRGISLRYETPAGTAGFEDSAVVATGTPQRWGNLYFWGGPDADTWRHDDAEVTKRTARSTRDILRRTRATLLEPLMWAPDDGMKLVPDRPTWRAGQCHAFWDIRALKASIRGAQAAGAAVTPYINTWIFGPHGFAKALDQPEWFYWRDNWYGGTFDVRDLASWDHPEALQPKPPFGQNPYHSWNGGGQGGLNSLANLVTVPGYARFHTDQVIALVKELGVDGVRYDNNGWEVRERFDAWGREVCPPDTKAAGAKLVRAFRAELEKTRPGFIYGNNGRGLDTGAWDPHSVASAERGGLVMEESFNSWMREGHVTWDTIVASLAERVPKVHAQGGHMVVIGPLMMQQGESLVDQRVGIAAIHAAGSQLCAGGSGSTTASPAYTTFGQRWSEILFDPAAVSVPPTDLTVTAPGALWASELTHVRDLGGKKRQYIIHAINKPVNQTINQQAEDARPGERVVVPGHNAERYAPPPLVQREVRFALKVPTGFTVSTAIAATPDAPVGAGVQALTAEAKAGTVTVTLPRLDLWTMIVIEGNLP
jgi:hypothetical protein